MDSSLFLPKSANLQLIFSRNKTPFAEEKTETTASKPHLWRQIFYKERAVGPFPNGKLQTNFNDFPGDDFTVFSSNPQAPHSAGFPEDEASISGVFLWNKNEEKLKTE